MLVKFVLLLFCYQLLLSGAENEFIPTISTQQSVPLSVVNMMLPKMRT